MKAGVKDLYKLIVVDDVELIRTMLAECIQKYQPNIEIAGVFSDGESVIEYLNTNHVDIIVTDIKMPVKTGLDIAQYVNDNFPDIMKNVGIFCTADKATVEMRYNQIPVNSPRMNYAGNWDTYTANSKFETTDSKISIGAGHYSYPYFTGGIKQVEKDTAAFGFMTNADAFCISYTASSAGSSAKVYIDGIESGTISCHSIYSGTNYTSKWIGLPGDGKEHKVILVVDRPTSDNYVYRFGSIIERFYR